MKTYDVVMLDAAGEVVAIEGPLPLQRARDAVEQWYQGVLRAHAERDGAWSVYGFAEDGECVQIDPCTVETIAVYDCAQDRLAWAVPVGVVAREAAACAAEQGPAGRLRTPLRAGEGTAGGTGATYLEREIRRAFRLH